MSHLFLSLGSQPFISLDWQVVAQLLNTLILFLILKKILFVKVKEFIDARQTEVDKMYADADTAMAEAERLKNVYSESVAGARDEAQRIVTDARKSAQDQADAILAEARAEAAALREKAEADIVSEKKKAVNEIKDEISDIAILIAEKVVEKEITPADHEKLIAQFIDRVGE